MKTINHYLLLLALLLSTGVLYAAAPSGYYKSAEGLSEKALLQKLCIIISANYKDVGYDGLWNVYKDSDVHPESGKIWDMYSTKDWSTNFSKCGSYSSVGDCINREHSFPQSWFGKASPMKSDAFHIYPTDGKVNGQRSNFPYGECANGKTLSGPGSIKGLGKLGTSTFPGYSGTVFEPVDEYKGDFARSYFYMAARYNTRFKSFNSPMLANNDYPCYKTWALNLLLKWHRQDPVSEKEITRNDAVYKHQRNRNPFIDHPELVEYIWGDLKGNPWQEGGAIVVPTLTSPTDGSVIDLGITSINENLTKSVTVKGVNLTKDLTITVAGAGFSVNATTVTAANANKGQGVVVTYKSATDATTNGTLTISSAEVKSTVTLKAQAVSSIPALPATEVGANSFVARWTDVHKDGGDYQLSVYDSAKKLLAGYPKAVKAASASYTVTGLNALSTYYYDLSRGALKSNQITVNTPDVTRSISATVEGGSLAFTSVTNKETLPIAVEIVTENIEENVTVDITGEFQISTDKTNWVSTLSVDKAGERIYVRMKALANGNYSGLLSAHTSTVEGFELDVTGTVSDSKPFFEDFEQPCANGSGYNEVLKVYQGTACKWNLQYAGIYSGDSNDRKEGAQSVRTSKDNRGVTLIEMAEDKPNGAGVVKFLSGLYGGDNPVVITLSYSTDGGKTWNEAGQFDVTMPLLTEYQTTINAAGSVRLKFGKIVDELGKHRINIDNVQITDYAISGGVSDIEAADKAWDAYCSAGKLVVETEADANIYIYNLEAETVFNGIVCGTEKIDLAKGVYVVVNGENSRKVIVK